MDQLHTPTKQYYNIFFIVFVGDENVSPHFENGVTGNNFNFSKYKLLSWGHIIEKVKLPDK